MCKRIIHTVFKTLKMCINNGVPQYSHIPQSPKSLPSKLCKQNWWFGGGGRLIYNEHREEGWSLEAGPLTLNNERRDGLWGQAHLH